MPSGDLQTDCLNQFVDMFGNAVIKKIDIGPLLLLQLLFLANGREQSCGERRIDAVAEPENTSETEYPQGMKRDLREWCSFSTADFALSFDRSGTLFSAARITLQSRFAF